jgi:transcriptional regulator with XRE-family HTH domain
MNEKMSFGELLKMRRQEETTLTRDQVADKTAISYSRLEKIERGLLAANAEDVVELSELYKQPDLCNYYCSNECPIGRDPDSIISRPVQTELSGIALSLLNSIKKLNDQKDRMVEITVDGKIESNELRDFFRLHNSLREISDIAASLSLWMRKQILEGQVDESEYEQIHELMEKLESK